MKQWRKIAALLLLAVCVVNTVGCSAEKTVADGRRRGTAMRAEDMELTAGAASLPDAEMLPMDENAANAYNDFAYRIFRECCKADTAGSLMVSPFSLYMALGMLTNGAKGQTKDELEKALGMDIETLNRYCAGWTEQLTNDRFAEFHSANSFWIDERYKDGVREEFLAACNSYYKASVFRSKLTESVPAINRWVKDKTDGMIPELLQFLPPETATVLINAIVFDAEWSDEFEKTDTRDGIFTKEDGTTETRSMMHGTADDIYYENELCTGFLKSYMGGRFAYVALLPKEGVSLETLNASVNTQSMKDIMTHSRCGDVYITVPVYSEDYSVSLVDALKAMGVEEAFNSYTADFMGMMKENPVYVSEILQKTRIEVNESGTKAAAATAVVMYDCCMAVRDEKPVYYVNLDRPFMYMIMDTETNTPIFIGNIRG